ncbi:MAG: PKD domain-containing protein [Candidatus Bipolaricaulaceae bacterium]
MAEAARVNAHRHWSGVYLVVLVCLCVLSAAVTGQGASYAVSVTATRQKLAYPGEIVTHVFTVSNQGTLADTYALELTLPENWTALPIPNTLSVAAGSQGIVFVNLSVPPRTDAGVYEVVLEAKSSADPTARAAATARVQVQPLWDFRLEWERQPPRAQPAGTVEGSVRVSNVGNVPDTYRLELTVTPGWEARASAAEFSLLPRESKVVEFFVQVPITAVPGTRYTISVAATSQRATTLIRTLTASGRLAPLPPELVGGSLFPEWNMSVTFAMDEDADPSLRLHGWGDIPTLGYLNAGVRLTVAGTDDAYASLIRDDWSVYLDGGSIAGTFLGVSGSPLFGGRIGEWGSWRLLFTEQVKGVAATLQDEVTAVSLTMGSDAAVGRAFEEVAVRHDFPGPFSGWALLSQGVQTRSAIICGLGGVVTLDEIDVEASCLLVPPGYPTQAPRLECDLRASYTGCPFPMDAAWSLRRTLAGSPPDEFHIYSGTLRFSASWPASQVISPALSLQIGHRLSDDSLISTEEWSYGLSASLQGTTPFPWAVNGSTRIVDDIAAGTTTTAHRLSASAELAAGAFRLAPGMSVEHLAGATGTTTSSAFSLVFDSSELAWGPRVTLSVGQGEGKLGFHISGTVEPDTDLDWSWEHSVVGGWSWSTQLTASFPAIFPFCGPTKGRLRGRAFADANGNQSWDPGEEGVAGILIAADGVEAITGAQGQFVFPPLDPGTYRLSLAQLPPGLTSAIPLPLRVYVSPGEEPEILLPLRPQSWLRGVVFNDKNENGHFEAGEGRVAGVGVLVRGPDEEERKFTTDNSGQFVVELVPGEYTVSLQTDTLPPRFVPTTPATVQVITPEYGTTQVSFGVYQKPRPVVVTFAPPTAGLTYEPSEPAVAQPVLFSGAPSQAVNADITAYAWTFKLEESTIRAEGQEVEISFPAPGDWQVVLVVTDSNGLQGATKASVRVHEAP